jgi:hypothetical protein
MADDFSQMSDTARVANNLAKFTAFLDKWAPPNRPYGSVRLPKQFDRAARAAARD